MDRYADTDAQEGSQSPLSARPISVAIAKTSVVEEPASRQIRQSDASQSHSEQDETFNAPYKRLAALHF